LRTERKGERGGLEEAEEEDLLASGEEGSKMLVKNDLKVETPSSATTIHVCDGTPMIGGKCI